MRAQSGNEASQAGHGLERAGGRHTTRFDRPTDDRTNGTGGRPRATVTAAGRTRAGPPKVRWSKETIKMTSSSRLSLPCRPSLSNGGRADGRRCRTREELRSRALSRTRSGQALRATRGAMNPTSKREAEGRSRERGRGGREETRSRSLRRRAGKARRRDRLWIAYRR